MPGHKILDEVLHTQKESELLTFEPQRYVNELLEQLDSRAKNVLAKRFGLDGNRPKTLESLGKNYGITRERVRQIENLSVKQLKRSGSANLDRANKVIHGTLTEAGGVMEQEALLDALLSDDKGSAAARAAMLFLLTLSPEVTRFAEDFNQKTLWASSRVAHDSLVNLIGITAQVLAKVAKPQSLEQLVAGIHQVRPNVTEAELKATLSASKAISQNPFGEYGLVVWSEIMPKGVRDKAYLVLRKEGKPLHFLKITAKINEVKFDQRTAYPQTVHNELIKDKRFVLVGRGIYALREWGYIPGTVAEVLMQILKAHAGPMERGELLKEVLKRRIVKRNTVLIGLQDKSRFVKLDGQRYDLVAR
ncbi:MAG: HTH domain-containing protein [Parcubacteria group bacterium]